MTVTDRRRRGVHTNASRGHPLGTGSAAMPFTIVTTIALAIALGFPGVAAAQAAEPAILSTPHFAFHSDFATNLNDTLVADFVARRDGRAGLLDGGAGNACFDQLAAGERAGWANAVEYYRTNQSTPFQRVLLRLELAGLVQRNTLTDAALRDVLEAFATARTNATPAYRTCLWPAMDAANRTWIANVEPLLRAHQAGLGEQLPRLFKTPWAFLPFRVDVVSTGPPPGANAASDAEGRMHILVSSANAGNQGLAALEVVFHEAAHFLVQPKKPLSDALETAATKLGVTLPGDLLHQVHFFITGESVRRSLERTGTSYTPYLYAHKLFGDRFRESAMRIWPAYMDGTSTLDQAASDLVGSMK